MFFLRIQNYKLEARSRRAMNPGDLSVVPVSENAENHQNFQKCQICRSHSDQEPRWMQTYYISVQNCSYDDLELYLDLTSVRYITL